jgi:hypothetical protein
MLVLLRAKLVENLLVARSTPATVEVGLLQGAATWAPGTSRDPPPSGFSRNSEHQLGQSSLTAVRHIGDVA